LSSQLILTPVTFDSRLPPWLPTASLFSFAAVPHPANTNAFDMPQARRRHINLLQIQGAYDFDRSTKNLCVRASGDGGLTRYSLRPQTEQGGDARMLLVIRPQERD